MHVQESSWYPLRKNSSSPHLLPPSIRPSLPLSLSLSFFLCIIHSNKLGHSPSASTSYSPPHLLSLSLSHSKSLTQSVRQSIGRTIRLSVCLSASHAITPFFPLSRTRSLTRSPSVMSPLLIPLAAITMVAAMAALKMAVWPKLRRERLVCVLRAATSYSEGGETERGERKREGGDAGKSGRGADVRGHKKGHWQGHGKQGQEE